MSVPSDSFEDLLREAARAPSLPLVDPVVGALLGPYTVESRIGAGGMGTVYRARDTRLGRAVALKVVPAGSAALREARCAARVSHPNIAALYDVGQDDVRGWIAFELIDGPTLASRLPAGVTRSEADTLAVGLARALRHLHAQGLVHGDLSPRNVLLGDAGPVLIDFGLASAAGSVQVGGTRGFVAPEVVEGGRRDARADVFAFGALLLSQARASRALRRLAERCVSEAPAARPDDGDALVRALTPRRMSARAGAIGGVVFALLMGLLVALVALLVPGAGGGWDGRRALDVAANPPTASTMSPPERLTFYTEEGAIDDAAVSPDGSRVALLDVSGAWLLRTDGARRRALPLPPSAGPARAVSWMAPDHVLLSAERGAYRIEVSSLSLTPLALPSGVARASVSGWVLVSSGVLLRLGRLREGAFQETRRVPVLGGALVASACSPDGATFAWIVFESEDTARLFVHDVASETTRVLAESSRLVADSGVAALAFNGPERLVLGLAPIPGEGREAALVSTPIEAWAPRPLHPLSHPATRLSVDRRGGVVFAQQFLQSDTVVMTWDGADLGPIERLSLSARDDRPTDWTEAHGLLGMMRVGAEHRVVQIPERRGTPTPEGPEGWWTWPQFTSLGLLGFRPASGADRVDWVIDARDGSPPRVLASLAERVGDEGTGRAVPRSGAFDCTPDGRCALAELRDGLRLTLHALADADAPRVVDVSPAVIRLHDVAVDAEFERVAISTDRGVFVVDTGTGSVSEPWVPSPAGVYQYLAPDGEGGWFVTALSVESPRFRLLQLASDGASRPLRQDAHAWMANPTPSPSGDRLALSVMRLRSDLYRVEIPPL